MANKILAVNVLLALVTLLAAGATPAKPALAGESPNILLVLTDDQEDGHLDLMPKLRRAVAAEGVTFDNAYTPSPQCCPARASIYSGQYVHNHGVLFNVRPWAWERWRRSGAERSSIAPALDAAGYTTGFAGRYMNNYGGQQGSPTTFVPPGWDRWFGWQGGRNQPSPDGSNSYRVNENGTIKSYARGGLNETDYIKKKASEFIRNRAGEDAPWFYVAATNAPHRTYNPADRWQGFYEKEPMPRAPNFNEADVSDKPAYYAAEKLKSPRAMQEEWQDKREDLRTVDDLVGALDQTIAATGQADETWVFYVSDNGWSQGAHRFVSKGAPYEESIGVPFLVKGPDGYEMRRDALEEENIVGLQDLAPTFADLAGVGFEQADGRSIVPVLSNRGAPWREVMLSTFPVVQEKRTFDMLISSDGDRFIDYIHTGEKEYYDLEKDPYQLENSYDELDPVTKARLQGRLDALTRCEREECRALENSGEASRGPSSVLRILEFSEARVAPVRWATRTGTRLGHASR